MFKYVVVLRNSQYYYKENFMYQIKVCYIKSENMKNLLYLLDYLDVEESLLEETIEKDVKNILSTEDIVHIHTINSHVVDCFRVLLVKGIVKPREIVFTVYHPDLENEYEFFEYPHQSGKMSWEYWSERGRGRARVLSQLAGI